MDIHALIQDFLQQQTILPLSGSDQDPALFIKAGIVPFLRKDGYRFYVMKPVSRHASLSAPDFQLCKGTRMYLAPGKGWHDMRGGEKAEVMETLAATALREGIEELGLMLSSIRTLFDVGPYAFSSSSSGKSKRMWMFAAEMASAEDVLPSIEVAFTTAGRAWLSSGQFTTTGRKDHVPTLLDIEKKLQAHYAPH